MMSCQHRQISKKIVETTTPYYQRKHDKSLQNLIIMKTLMIIKHVNIAAETIKPDNKVNQ